MSTPRIAVVSAGLSQPSSTRMLADRLVAATTRDLAAAGQPPLIESVELREHARDLADRLVTGFAPAGLREAIERVTGADALITVTPIFTASYSGLFKTFFDVLDPDTLVGKPTLIGATGGSPRHSLALEHAVRPLFTYLRSVVVPTAVYAATEEWGERGLQERIDRAGGELAGLMLGRSAAATLDPYDDVVPFADMLAAQRP